MKSLIILLSVVIFAFLAASLSVPGGIQNEESEEENIGEQALTEEDRKTHSKFEVEIFESNYFLQQNQETALDLEEVLVVVERMSSS